MKFLKKLFKDISLEREEGEESVGKEVVSQELIRRDRFFQKKYDEWLEDRRHEGLLSNIQENYQIREQSPGSDSNFYMHQLTNSKGFYFRQEYPWTSEDYNYLIQYFIDKLKRLGYRQANTRRELALVNEVPRIGEEFYLKPSLKYRRDLPYEQLFGNIFIEHRMLDGETELLKLMVHTYSDRSYKEAKDYRQLLDELFQY
jgi:hypothetical protein